MDGSDRFQAVKLLNGCNHIGGFTIVKAFAANGVEVYTTGRRLDVLEKAAALQVDVTNEECLKAGAKHIEGIDGKLDILVNNAEFAGSLRDPDFITKTFATSDPFEPETVQNRADIFALNTIAPFFVVRAFQFLLVKGARSRPQGTSSVINISSVATKMNTPTLLSSVAYLMTGSALDKLTLVLRMSFTQRDVPIRVNVLAPGVFACRLIIPEVLEAIKTKLLPGMITPIPAKRQGTEAEMGMRVVYLAVSNYTSGAVLSIDDDYHSRSHLLISRSK